uniref:Peptidase S1 domain-containing protein n=1 Tax=Terrapene triunguis TaxID=2587831 RepID=A0A674I7Q0_9SAUR
MVDYILLLQTLPLLLTLSRRASEIIDGWEAQPHSRPYMAYLEIQHGVNRSLCGGFLVSENFVLTALERKARLNGYVGLIPLPVAHHRMCPGTVCSITGWGWTSAHNNRSSDTLREADVEVMQDAACPRDPGGIYRDYNPSTMMCVGDPEKGKSSFKGDSGGPLVCQQTAQGIVSWGSEVGTPPAVYTRVSTFIPWIRKTMRMLQP